MWNIYMFNALEALDNIWGGDHKATWLRWKDSLRHMQQIKGVLRPN